MSVGAGDALEAEVARLREIVADLGRQLSEAHQAEKALRESERRVRGAVEALAEIGRTLSQPLDPDAVARRVAEALKGLLRARSAAVYLLEPGTERLVKRIASLESGEAFDWASLTRARQGADRHGRGRGRLDVSAGRPRGLGHRVSPRGAGPSSPCRSASPSGRWGPSSWATPPGRTFQPDEIDLVEAFARQAALALENARIHAEVVQAQREAEELARVARLFTETLDVATVADVYSEPGRGTTFKVYLPRVDDPVTVAVREDAGVAPSGSETVLLVERPVLHDGGVGVARHFTEGFGTADLRAANALLAELG